MGGRYDNSNQFNHEYNGRYMRSSYGGPRFPPNDGRFGRDFHRKVPPQRWQSRIHNNINNNSIPNDRRRNEQQQQQQQQPQAIITTHQPLQQALFIGEKAQDMRSIEKNDIETKLRSFPVAVDLMESVTDAMTALLVTLASSTPVELATVRDLLNIEIPSRLLHLQVRVAARGLSIPYRRSEAEQVNSIAVSENILTERNLKKEVKEAQKQVSEAKTKRGIDIEAERLAGQCLDLESQEFYEETQARNNDALRDIEDNFKNTSTHMKEMAQILNGALNQMESLIKQS